MTGFLRLGIVLLVGLTVLYFLLSIYGRSLARERLEKRWDGGRGRGSRDHFIQLGLKKYERSARKRLLILVFVVPIVTIFTLIYVLNFS